LKRGEKGKRRKKPRPLLRFVACDWTKAQSTKRMRKGTEEEEQLVVVGGLKCVSKKPTLHDLFLHGQDNPSFGNHSSL
jgi:hypothetical protein